MSKSKPSDNIFGWIILIVIVIGIYSIFNDGDSVPSPAGDSGNNYVPSTNSQDKILKVLRNIDAGYSITYNPNWGQITPSDENSIGELMRLTDDKDDTVNIFIDQFDVYYGTTQQTLNSDVLERATEMERNLEAEDIRVYDTTLAGVNVKRIEYEARVDDVLIHVTTYYILNPAGTKSIHITYTASNKEDFNKYYAEASKIISSFKFN